MLNAKGIKLLFFAAAFAAVFFYFWLQDDELESKLREFLVADHDGADQISARSIFKDVQATQDIKQFCAIEAYSDGIRNPAGEFELQVNSFLREKRYRGREGRWSIVGADDQGKLKIYSVRGIPFMNKSNGMREFYFWRQDREIVNCDDVASISFVRLKNRNAHVTLSLISN